MAYRSFPYRNDGLSPNGTPFSSQTPPRPEKFRGFTSAVHGRALKHPATSAKDPKGPCRWNPRRGSRLKPAWLA